MNYQMQIQNINSMITKVLKAILTYVKVKRNRILQVGGGGKIT